MSPVVSEIIRSGFMINSSFRRRTHLVQSFSVVFLYWFYVFSEIIFQLCPSLCIYMASSSGDSSGFTQLQNSGSEENTQMMLVDQRKRKRMQSNRESARRSRMKKQKHLDDLMTQVTQLRKDNNQILTTINVTTQHYLNVEAENSILRAQMMELNHRLDSLNEILNYINTSNGIFENDHHEDLQTSADHSFMNPLNLLYLNQPIMASPDLFQY
ncbi:hypothetical protein NC651_014360 [Populus alba x Populus x berolinensis]|nr:hypothetical protein NC651_014360 [Populus alba x Populus x berolinensis]